MSALKLKAFVRVKAGHLIERVEERMRAVAEAKADAGSVHDLRTAIRRLSECLKTFDNLFPEGEAGRVRRKLRKLMGLAGEVRNRDISADLFLKAAVAVDDVLFVRLGAEKLEWQGELMAKLIEWNKRERPRAWRGALKVKMTGMWKAAGSVDKNAGRVLSVMAANYFEAGEGLFGGGKTPDELHAFRLRTKRFRYTLELFEERYGPRFGTLLKRLKPLQQALGDINDAATALAWLQPGESKAARQFLEARIVEKSEHFARYWTTVFDKPGQRLRWATVLAGPSGSVGVAGSGDPQ